MLRAANLFLRYTSTPPAPSTTPPTTTSTTPAPAPTPSTTPSTTPPVSTTTQAAESLSHLKDLCITLV